MKPKKELNIQIGEQIKKARENNRLTQEQFAEMIDRTPQFISDLERGVSGISIETLRLICEKLAVSSDSILFSSYDLSENTATELTNKLRRMTKDQRYIISQITDAFISATKTIEERK